MNRKPERHAHKWPLLLSQADERTAIVLSIPAAFISRAHNSPFISERKARATHTSPANADASPKPQLNERPACTVSIWVFITAKPLCRSRPKYC